MKHYFLFVLAIFFYACANQDSSTINLSGEWMFQTDPEDRGMDEKWFNIELQETIQLPGSMVENGKGDDITLETQWTGGVRNPDWFNDPNYSPYVDPNNVRFPFWLQPEKNITAQPGTRRNLLFLPTGIIRQSG
jgi:hypothetical protein